MPQPTWMFIVDALAGLAAVAVAVFAGVEIWRGRKITARADAEVGALAFALRRQLNSIVGGPSYLTAAALQARAKEVATQHYPDAESRAVAMVTGAGGASENIAAPARRAYVLFFRAADEINAVSEGGPRTDAESGRPPGWDQWQDAMDLLAECVRELGAAIPKELREAGAGDLEVHEGLRGRLSAAWDAASTVEER